MSKILLRSNGDGGDEAGVVTQRGLQMLKKIDKIEKRSNTHSGWGVGGWGIVNAKPSCSLQQVQLKKRWSRTGSNRG